MKKGIILIILILVFPGYSFAFDDGDFQYWNTESVSWKINKDWKGAIEEEFRFGDDASNLYYQHTDLGLAYSGLAEWMDISLNYRHILEEKSSHWKQENMPNINAILKWKVCDIDLSNRLRLEYRNRESAEDCWRYRDKFAVKLPIKLSRFEIQPYIEEEIFYDFNDETLNRNRLSNGVYLKLLKNLQMQVFYLWQSDEKNEKWNDTHVLGTKLRLSF